ncbi:unnamed protein product [Phytophthora fragariaefolia]|uniref:Unnamed protein product n=1 Tax=Phytophthora fragariaefolia TaxID=1490495 RepID=A0A9W7CTD8_9STRA|nr:unnamed protein product [Phytophthora fragariaefolia]
MASMSLEFILNKPDELEIPRTRRRPKTDQGIPATETGDQAAERPAQGKCNEPPASGRYDILACISRPSSLSSTPV